MVNSEIQYLILECNRIYLKKASEIDVNDINIL